MFSSPHDISMCSTLHYVASTAATHNNFLPESIRTRARQLLNQAQSEVGFIENEVARLQAMLNDLDQRRHDKLAEIELYKSTLSPLRKLPNELLSYIFILCCDDNVAIPYKLNQQQWLLSRVCSKWRSVSLSTPQIWNHIRVHHSSHSCAAGGKRVGSYPIPYSTFIKMVEEALLRSGEIPLFLTVLDDTNDSVSPIDPLIPHLTRVRELYLKRAPSTAKAFLGLQPYLVPSLETIEITDYSKVAISDGGVLQSARSLKKVEYRSYRVRLAWIHDLPLVQLTHLNIPSSMLRPSQILTILQLAPNLVDCAFAVGVHVNPHESDPPHPSFIDLSAHFTHNLHSFHLNVFGIDNEIIMLQNLILPNLRHCAFQTGQQREWDPRWAPMILHSRSLETLILKDTIVSPSELEHLLETSPHLSKLDVSSGRMMTTSILRKLARGVLAPQLIALRCLIESNTMGELAFEQHLDMLEQRRKGNTLGRHIEKVHFTLFGVEDMNLMYPGLQPRLTQMNTDGWEIVISCPSIDIF